jgi:hypothetical protein
VQRAVLTDRLVRKAVNLTDVQNVGTKVSDDCAAALGTEIEG